VRSRADYQTGRGPQDAVKPALKILKWWLFPPPETPTEKLVKKAWDSYKTAGEAADLINTILPDPNKKET